MDEVTYLESEAIAKHQRELDMAFDVLFEEVIKRSEYQEVVQEEVIDNYVHLGIPLNHEVSN
jgi:hypothetical protein